MIRPPAPRPCISCPYRRDVPSGVWARTEYLKLPLYDGDTGSQVPQVFMCHQQDNRACAGWASLADSDTLALRVAVSAGAMTPEVADAVVDYRSPVPLFASGREACEHGLRDLLNPSEPARQMARKLS